MAILIKRTYYIIIVLLLLTVNLKGQITISGKVISKVDTLPVPGVDVLEKGTNNRTSTNLDGYFSIRVADPNAVLIFSFIGMIPQEIPLKGRKEILVKVKWDCNKDFFDSRQVVLGISTGVINNPVGFYTGVNSPYIFGGVIKGTVGYQTNLKNNNELFNGKIEFSHFISTCDFDIDILGDYRHVSFKGDSKIKSTLFEGVLNIRYNKYIAGYSYLDFNSINNHDHLYGILLGAGKKIVLPPYPIIMVVTGRIAFYKNRIEFLADLQGEYRHLNWFIKYYKLNSFNELSIGVGIGIGY